MPAREGSDAHGGQLWWWLENQLRSRRGWDLENAECLEPLLAKAESDGLDTSWKSRYQWATLSPTLAQRGLFFAPAYVVEFLTALVSKQKTKRVLDPWGAGGLLAASVLHQNAAEAAVAVAPQQMDCLDGLLPKDHTLEVVHGSPLEALSADLGSFDALVCVPPMGMKAVRCVLQSDDGPVELKADPAVTTLIKASTLLGNGGFGVAVLPWKARQTVAAELPRFGFHVSVLVALPPVRNLATSSIPLEVVVWSRDEPESVFVGRLRVDGDNTALLNNLAARRVGDAPELGRLVPLESYTSFDRVVLDEDIRRTADTSGGQVVDIGEVAVATNLGKRSEDGGFDPLPNAIYVPLIGEGPVATSSSDLHIKPQNYIQVVLDPERALAEYAAGWLDSEIGRTVRRAATSGFIPKLSKGTVGRVALVLPSIDVQAETVAAHRMILEVDQRLAELRHGLWERPGAAEAVRHELHGQSQSSFDGWVESLPFPLASVLRRYEATSTAERKVEYLRRCFEATAQ